MSSHPISPELALVDPELRARALASLPSHPGLAYSYAARAPVAEPVAPTPAPAAAALRYPAWARITATLWVLVVGILIGGVAVPHAQDRPRVVPTAEDVTVCEPPPQQTLPVPRSGAGNP